MDWVQTLTTFCQSFGVSGRESPAAQKALEMLKPLCDKTEIVHGNVFGHLGEHSPEKPHILLDAHMDQVGFVVTSITDEGFVRCYHVGGIDYRLLPAQRVLLHGKEDIPGVICAVPPHLQNGEPQILKPENLLIDTGYNKADLEAILSPGDMISYDMPLQQLENGRVAGSAFDDRAGVAVILYALELLRGKTLPCSVTALFSTQEEVGSRGATIGGYRENPDVAIAVDVSFAWAHGEEPERFGTMGKGPMIGTGPSLSPQLTDALQRMAKDENIPWQPEAMGGDTGTNADSFSILRTGIPTAVVSIPLRYMHTPSEVIEIADLERTGALLAAYILHEGGVQITC